MFAHLAFRWKCDVPRTSGDDLARARASPSRNGGFRFVSLVIRVIINHWLGWIDRSTYVLRAFTSRHTCCKRAGIASPIERRLQLPNVLRPRADSNHSGRYLTQHRKST